MNTPKKVAIVADWLTNQGGAERVISAIAKLYPQAVIFTSVYVPGSVPDLARREIKTTFLQKLPAKLRKKHQFLLPFFPMAFERLDLSEFDIIISSSSAFAKSVKKTRKDQVHICYCHTPVRYLYNAREEYLTTYPLPWFLKPFKFLLPMVLNYLTKKDLRAVEGVDFFISNSDFIGERIFKYYHKLSTTIYPCVDLDNFYKAGLATTKKKDYFLAVGRFIPYKKFDLLVETFVKNKLPLKLAGTGPELERCKKLASGAPNIEFLGFVLDADLPQLYAEAKAFLFPAEEDFGLTPVEALGAGTPVIGFNNGGVTESVTYETGVFFERQMTSSLQQGIDLFLEKEGDFDKNALQSRGKIFDEKQFQGQLKEFVEAHV